MAHWFQGETTNGKHAWFMPSGDKTLFIYTTSFPLGHSQYTRTWTQNKETGYWEEVPCKS